jgi:hypothetical protein
MTVQTKLVSNGVIERWVLRDYNGAGEGGYVIEQTFDNMECDILYTHSILDAEMFYSIEDATEFAVDNAELYTDVRPHRVEFGFSEYK